MKSRIQGHYIADRDDIFLECGCDYFHESPLDQDPELLRKVWREHGDDFLERFAAIHSGVTPWALKTLGIP